MHVAQKIEFAGNDRCQFFPDGRMIKLSVDFLQESVKQRMMPAISGQYFEQAGAYSRQVELQDSIGHAALQKGQQASVIERFQPITQCPDRQIPQGLVALWPVEPISQTGGRIEYTDLVQNPFGGRSDG